ncbi:MAG: DUF5667 domain-containing protein [Nanoarchaeota archaeon]
MQKIITGISLICMLIAVTGFASAQNETVEAQENLREAGTKPGSLLYGLDRAMENIKMTFTFNREKKALYGLEIAEERLSEAKELIEMNKTEEAQKATQEHEKIMNKAKENVQEIEANSDEESSKKAIQSTYSIEERLQKHREKIASVHSGILERLETQGNMSEEQLDHLEEVFGRIQSRTGEVETSILQKREKAQMRYKVVANKSAQEIGQEFVKEKARVQEAKNKANKSIEERQEIGKQYVEKARKNIPQAVTESLEEMSNSKSNEEVSENSQKPM